jgi:hypothetical protein
LVATLPKCSSISLPSVVGTMKGLFCRKKFI